MRLKIGGSSSDGNCYALTDSEGHTLLVEAGIPYGDIARLLDWQITGVVGCITTHRHKDHSQSVEKLKSIGITCFTPWDGSEKDKAFMGKFLIRSFALEDSEGNPTHTNGDGTYCPIYGYKIYHPEMGTLIYLTDCKFCQYTFKSHNVNHFLLGVNYQEEYLPYDEGKKAHVVSGHMSEKTAIALIKASQTNSLQNIILGHLSEGSCNPDTLLERVSKVATAGVQTHIAVKGMELDLKRDCPF